MSDSAVAEQAKPIDVQLLPVCNIVESKSNPRKTFAEKPLADLTASVKRLGVQQPVKVRPRPDDGLRAGEARYELVFGARRFRAAGRAGLVLIPAIVQEMTDDEVLDAQIAENLQREDVHPLEEAESYERLRERELNNDQIAKRVGKSRSYVFGRMKLLDLSPAMREEFLSGTLPASHALVIARIPVAELQAQAFKDITGGVDGRELMSYREAVEHVQRTYMLRLKDAPFDRNDPKLLADVGACGGCPFRTGNQKELFKDVGSADVCTKPPCYHAKADADFAQRTRELADKGAAILSADESKEVLPYGTDYVEPRSGFVKLDDTTVTKNGMIQSWAKAIPAEKRPAPAAVARKTNGDALELFRRADLEEAAAAHGIEVRQPEREDYGYGRSDKRQRDQSALSKLASEQLLADLVAKVDKVVGKMTEDATELLRLLVHRITRVSWHDAVQHVVKRRGLESGNKRGEEIIAAAIPDMTAGEVVGLLVELAALRNVSYAHQTGGAIPGPIVDFAKHFKLDPKRYVQLAREMKKTKKKATGGAKAKRFTCSKCGCNEKKPCKMPGGGICGWTNAAGTLCSACTRGRTKPKGKKARGARAKAQAKKSASKKGGKKTPRAKPKRAKAVADDGAAEAARDARVLAAIPGEGRALTEWVERHVAAGRVATVEDRGIFLGPDRKETLHPAIANVEGPHVHADVSYMPGMGGATLDASDDVLGWVHVIIGLPNVVGGFTHGDFSTVADGVKYADEWLAKSAEDVATAAAEKSPGERPRGKPRKGTRRAGRDPAPADKARHEFAEELEARAKGCVDHIESQPAGHELPRAEAKFHRALGDALSRLAQGEKLEELQGELRARLPNRDGRDGDRAATWGEDAAEMLANIESGIRRRHAKASGRKRKTAAPLEFLCTGCGQPVPAGQHDADGYCAKCIAARAAVPPPVAAAEHRAAQANERAGPDLADRCARCGCEYGEHDGNRCPGGARGQKFKAVQFGKSAAEAPAA